MFLLAACSSGTVRDRRLAAEMLAAMGERPVVVLRGHGLTATGDGPVQAVLRAISVDTLARMTMAVVGAGGRSTCPPGQRVQREAARAGPARDLNG